MISSLKEEIIAPQPTLQKTKITVWFRLSPFSNVLRDIPFLGLRALLMKDMKLLVHFEYFTDTLVYFEKQV
jgi:hypothetical protein